VTWSTGNGSPGIVTVASKGLKETLFASVSEGSEAAPWISVGQTYVFRLYSIVSGRRLLARLRVNRVAALEVLAPPQSPQITSSVVDRLLQLFSFGSVALLALLTAMYVRETRRNG
jgi:predicted RNA-binding protein (virulence factor B family)